MYHVDVNIKLIEENFIQISGGKTINVIYLNKIMLEF